MLRGSMTTIISRNRLGEPWRVLTDEAPVINRMANLSAAGALLDTGAREYFLDPFQVTFRGLQPTGEELAGDAELKRFLDAGPVWRPPTR